MDVFASEIGLQSYLTEFVNQSAWLDLIAKSTQSIESNWRAFEIILDRFPLLRFYPELNWTRFGLFDLKWFRHPSRIQLIFTN